MSGALFFSWSRLGLAARLMLSTGLALALMATAYFYYTLENEVTFHRDELNDRLNYELDFLVPAVADPALVGDYSLIREMLDKRANQPHVVKIAWIDSRGNKVEGQSAVLPAAAPKWFIEWLDFPAFSGSREINVGGHQYGHVEIELTPTPTIHKLLLSVYAKLEFLLFSIGILFAITLAVVGNALRPLYALATAARKFGQGDHSFRLEPYGPPEMITCVQAFNSMAEDIQMLVSTQKSAENALFKEKELAQVTLASIADAVITTDTAGRVEYLNGMAEQLLEWKLDDARGKPLEEVVNAVNEASQEKLYLKDLVAHSSSEEVRGSAVLIRRGGKATQIETAAASICDSDRRMIGSVLVFRDVSHSHQMARKLTWQATHDALTSLVNRREFERRLKDMVELARIESGGHAMLYLDLDQFKVVNDTCGHLAGDELLRQLSGRLKSRMRNSDTLARLGGDEFGVLYMNCSLGKAMELAEQLRSCISEFRFAWQDKLFMVGVSIGVVSIEGGTQTPEDVMALADAACYQAKDKGRNRIQPALQDKELANRRSEMLWVSRINTAMENNRFVLHCQPIEQIVTSLLNASHYEVLVRMLDEQGNLVMPMAFIPAAERYNLMQGIDRRVITMVFEFLTANRGRLLAEEHVTISINLSGQSLGDEKILGFIQEQFARYPVSPQSICFEITETAAIGNLSQAISLINELKKMGCRFSLDDFGSGLSSFGYLKNLPVTYLKIDGSFIRDMVHDPIDAAMVRAISDIGRVMGIKTIAEWVDNQETLNMLEKEGVDFAQGYYIGKPFPIEQLFGHKPAEVQDSLLKMTA